LVSRRYAEERHPFRQYLVVAGILALGAIAGHTLFNMTYSTLGISSEHLLNDFGRLYLAVPSVTLILITQYRFKKGPKFSAIMPSIFVGLMVLTVVHLLGERIYGKIPEAWGGGKPTIATLIFTNEGATAWQKAGMPLLGGAGPMNSDKISVIYQGDRDIVVEGSYQDQGHPKKKLVIVNHSLVDIIVPDIDIARASNN
jgi:hypothetical protein